MNDFVINIISMDKRVDRRKSLIDHLYDLRYKYFIWRGIDNHDLLPYKNIIKAHKQIVKYAKESGLPHILIAEDDLRFSSKNSLQHFIDTIPEKFDLYFGMIYTGTIQDRRITNGFSGMQFYLIHKKFYDHFLMAPNNKHLDQWLGESCHEYDFYCCDPFICYGESGYSDNFKKEWVFNEDKLPRKLLKDAQETNI
jgi:hypothetical protein